MLTRRHSHLPSTTRSGCVSRMKDKVPGKSECAEKEMVMAGQRTSICSEIFPFRM